MCIFMGLSNSMKKIYRYLFINLCLMLGFMITAYVFSYYSFICLGDRIFFFYNFSGNDDQFVKFIFINLLAKKEKKKFRINFYTWYFYDILTSISLLYLGILNMSIKLPGNLNFGNGVIYSFVIFFSFDSMFS